MIVEKPLISIITPTYNSERFIGFTIESILNQSYTNWELLITDDASGDGTWKILEEYSLRDKRIKIFRLEINSGSGLARNSSIKEASGGFIAFCDSDDYWHKDKLKNQLEFMQSNSYTFTYTRYAIVNESNELKKESNVAPKQCAYFRLLVQNCIGCSTVMVDVHQLGKEYMPDLRNRQDWGLWLKYIRKSGKAFRLQESNTYYRLRKHSISSNKIKLFKYHWQIYNKVEGYNVFTSALLFILNIPTVLYYMLRNR